MQNFALLRGLPPYGAPARPFPAEWGRLGREGVVVRFVQSDGCEWVGNFARGLDGVTGAYQHPDGRRVLVLANGDLLAVDPDTAVAEGVASCVTAIWPVQQPQGFVLELQGLAFARLNFAGIQWHTRRLSFDGFSAVRLEDRLLTGLAWSPIENGWEPFEVDLQSGRSKGGSFVLEDSGGWEKLAE